MQQPTAKPLPEPIRRAIAHAFAGSAPLKVRLEVKKHANKQMTLTLIEGPFKRVLVRLHKRLHKEFYGIVAAARTLLENLTKLMVPAIVAPVALIPATCPVPAAQPTPARSLRALASERHMGHEVPARQYEAHVRANRALVMEQVVVKGLQ